MNTSIRLAARMPSSEGMRVVTSFTSPRGLAHAFSAIVTLALGRMCPAPRGCLLHT